MIYPEQSLDFRGHLDVKQRVMIDMTLGEAMNGHSTLLFPNRIHPKIVGAYIVRVDSLFFLHCSLRPDMAIQSRYHAFGQSNILLEA